MCVCFGDPCTQNFLDWGTILRDFCVEWIIGWVVCWIAFISVLFTSRKTILKTWLDTSSIPCYLSSFSSIFLKHNLDTSSIPGELIEKALASSIAPWHLLDRSSFYSWICSLLLDSFLDTLAIEDQILDTYLESFLDTSQYLSCRALLKLLYISQSRFFSHFFDLSRSICDCSSPKHSPFHSKPLPQGFFKLFQVSPYLVSS